MTPGSTLRWERWATRSINALAESVNGLYKTELVRNLGPWNGAEDLELETMIWVHWWTHRQLIDRLTPTEREEQHSRQTEQLVHT